MILVCILSFCRPHYLETTLESFTRLNRSLFNKHLVLIALDQEFSSSTSTVFDKYRNFFDRIFTTDKNLGIGWGFSQLVELSQLYSPEFILFLEDDWICRVSLDKFLSPIHRLFSLNPDVGTLRLRNVNDPVATINHVSGVTISTKEWESFFLIGNYHYVFNPHLVRSPVALKLVPAAGEHHAQINFHKLGLQGAQLMAEMFDHIGEKRAPARISRVPHPVDIVPHHSFVEDNSFYIRIPPHGMGSQLHKL